MIFKFIVFLALIAHITHNADANLANDVILAEIDELVDNSNVCESQSILSIFTKNKNLMTSYIPISKTSMVNILAELSPIYCPNATDIQCQSMLKTMSLESNVTSYKVTQKFSSNVLSIFSLEFAWVVLDDNVTYDFSMIYGTETLDVATGVVPLVVQQVQNCTYIDLIRTFQGRLNGSEPLKSIFHFDRSDNDNNCKPIEMESVNKITLNHTTTVSQIPMNNATIDDIAVVFLPVFCSNNSDVNCLKEIEYIKWGKNVIGSRSFNSHSAEKFTVNAMTYHSHRLYNDNYNFSMIYGNETRFISTNFTPQMASIIGNCTYFDLMRFFNIM